MATFDNTSLPTQDEIARSIGYEILSAAEELVKGGKDVEKLLATTLGERLQRIGYFVMVGTKEIFRDFNAAIDLIAWKSSSAQAVAIVIDTDMAGDRMLGLDEFQVRLLLPTNPLLKIFVDLNGEHGLRPPSTLGESYFYGLGAATSGHRQSPATGSATEAEDLF